MIKRMCGKLEIIIGGMFSGKSSELIRRLKRHRVIGDKVLVINSSKDTQEVKLMLNAETLTFYLHLKNGKHGGANPIMKIENMLHS